MSFRTLLDFLKPGRSLTPNQRARRGAHCLRPASCRLAIEALEDRLVPASLSVNDVMVLEGNDGNHNAEVIVRLSQPSSRTVTVNYGTSNGTATAGSDYSAVFGKLTFARGETSKTILVPVRGDRLAEPDETFSVKLSGAKNARIGDGIGVVTIRDDELHISIGDAGIWEGNSGTTLMTFTVSLSAAHHEAVTVDYATQDAWYYGSAYAGEDYRGTSGSVTFAPGETTKTITIEVFGDTEPEPNEEFYVVLSNASADVGISRGYGIGRIVADDDGWIHPEPYTGGEGGAYY